MKHSAFSELGLSLPGKVSTSTLLALFAATLGCAGVKPQNQTGSGGSRGGSTGSGSGGSSSSGSGGSSQPPPPPCANNLCTDFPADPIMDPGVPSGAAGMFSGDPPTSGGPCIMEPEDGTLFPNNWLRPRVKFTGANGKLVQIKMTADNQANALVAYTMADEWKMPADIWRALRGHQTENDVTVTVWVQGGGASSVKFSTAPVAARGNLVFWAANPAETGAQPPMCFMDISLCSMASELRGFSVGDESTVSVLQIAQVMQPSRKDSGDPSHVVCIGCHSGTPDSSFVSFSDHYPWRAALASVAGGTMSGAPYGSITASGLAALQQPGWGPFAWTKAPAFWTAGKKIGVGSLGLKDPKMPDYSNGPDQNDSPHLAWVNVEAPNTGTGQNGNWAYPSYAPGVGVSSGNSLGIMKHNGDAGGAAFPTWSRDGMWIAYASTNASISGRLNQEVATPMPMPSDPTKDGTTQNANAARKPGLTDIYKVLFNDGLGGDAVAVAGAATTDHEEYYPAYSPDDKLIAFTRVPAGQVMYANPNAEIAVVSASGGTAAVLRANDPPACSGKKHPGINNHWPKWSPEAATSSRGTYYWLIFSSNRADLTPVKSLRDGKTRQISQLYMAPVLQTEAGIQSFPAIYLWNQPTDRVNTTPAWETFMIPPVI